jgi:transposase
MEPRQRIIEVACSKCGYVHKATQAGYERMRVEYDKCLSCGEKLELPAIKSEER